MLNLIKNITLMGGIGYVGYKLIQKLSSNESEVQDSFKAGINLEEALEKLKSSVEKCESDLKSFKKGEENE